MALYDWLPRDMTTEEKEALEARLEMRALFHPDPEYDPRVWDDIELLRDENGEYIWGQPSEDK